MSRFLKTFDELISEWMNISKHVCRYQLKDEWLNGWMFEWMSEWINDQRNQKNDDKQKRKWIIESNTRYVWRKYGKFCHDGRINDRLNWIIDS